MDEAKKQQCGCSMGVLIVGVAVGIVGTLLVSRMSLVRNVAAPYKSSCIIKVGPSGTENILTDNRPAAPLPDAELVKARMLSYQSVMAALADTDLMNELEQASEEAPDRRGQLEDALYWRVVGNMKVKQLGRHLIKISYRDDTPDRTVTVLRKIVNRFVESALTTERTDARQARDRAFADIERSKEALEAVQAKLLSFFQEHPGVSGGSPRKELAETLEMLSKIDDGIATVRPMLDRCVEQIEARQKAPDSPEKKKAIAELSKKRSVLETKIDALMEMRRGHAARKASLEEEVRAFPVLHQQLARLEREFKAAEEDHDIAFKRARRVNEAFNNTVEGLVSVSVIRPARMPHTKD